MNTGGLLNRISKFFLGASQFSSAGVFGWNTPGEWNKLNLLKQNTRYVYTIISAIAQNAARVKFEVGKKNAVGDIIPASKHPFLDLLANPNPMVSQFQFLELHFTFMKLVGESYWYLASGEKSQKPKEVYLLRPDLMEVVIDKKDPRGIVGGYVMTRDGKKETFEPNEIIHFKLPNPLNPYYGFGVIQASKVYLETEEYASKWTRNSIYNSGRPSGVLNVKGTVSPEQFAALKRQFKQEYSGTKNAGKTLLLNGKEDLNYQKLGMELGEVALKELKDMTRDDIMIMFRLSKTILGITDDVNRANAQESRQVFTENIIKPELDRLVDHLNSFLMPLWGEGFVLNYEDPTLESDKDRLEMWTAGYNKWLTINDIRQELGYEPLEGGDVIREPIQNTPVTVPPKPKAGKSKASKLKKKELNEDRVNLFKQIFFDNQVLWERRFKRFMVEEFNTQRDEILEKHPTKDFKDWGFDEVASKERIVGQLTPMGIELMKEAGQFALDLAKDSETEFQINSEVQEFIHDRISQMATGTYDLTSSLIANAIGEGITAGESTGELRKRIEEIFNGATRSRAEMIARTETLAASNQGALEAYRQSPMVVAMEWEASPDACEFCAELDGTVVGLTENFGNDGGDITGSDGGSFNINYGDLDTPPLHPNCKCTVLPVAQ